MSRRVRRWSAVSLLLALLVLLLPPVSASAAPRQSSDLCTLPGTVISCSSILKGGIPADTAGTGAVAGAGAADFVPHVMAFLSGYQGSCWLLGKVFDGSCNLGNFWSNTMSWLGFGSNGDNRANFLTGAPWWSTSVCGGSQVCVPVAPLTAYLTDSATVVGLGNVSSGSFGLFVDCYDTTTSQLTPYYLVNSGSSGQSGGYKASFGCGSAAHPGGWPGLPESDASRYQVAGFRELSPYTGATTNGTTLDLSKGTIVARWEPDPNANSPWQMNWYETCRKGSTTADSPSVSVPNFTPAPGLVVPAPTLPDCDTIIPGSHVDKITGTGGRVGQPGDVTITQPTFNPSIPSAYPLCTDSLPVSTGGCYLDLKKNGTSCLDGQTVCAGWETYESQMTCTWGPYTVPIKWCEDDYGTAFDTEVAPKPGQSASASPGAAMPTTGTNVDSKPSGSPASGGVTGFADCMGGIWSWNPVDWIFTPVKCALVWAFVPDTSTLGDLLTGIKTNLESSGVGPWLTTLGPLFGGLGGNAAGCQGPAVTFPMTSTTVHPFDACTDPMATVASISYAFTSVAVVCLGGLQIARAVGAGFGFNLRFGERAKVSET